MGSKGDNLKKPTHASRSWKKFGRHWLMVSECVAVIICCALPASAMADATCENENLRASFGSLFLPDCRAYEMVSPPYKEGYPVFVANRATDGEEVILTSLGSLGNAGAGETVTRGTVYLGTRTAAGWKLSSLDARTSEFVGQVPLAIEPASGETLWEQHSPTESIDQRRMYVRTAGPTPAYRFVGPLNIPFEGESKEASTSIYLGVYHTTAPIAATYDYKHVVMEAGDEEDRWSFDETEAASRSLYEYSGMDNTHPILVAVNGQEKGSTDLISRCGAELGAGRFVSTYNAISRSGSTVFFTVLPKSECEKSPPEAVEIYARLNGAVIDPGPALTTDVSASECTIACGSKEPSGKNFEGASEDGNQVFFTSTQKLTNNAIDGTSSGDAAVGGGCSETTQGAGGCNLFEYRLAGTSGSHLHLIAAGEVLGVAGVAENGSRIYFVSRIKIESAGPNQFGEKPLGEQPNLYVYDARTDNTTFIATLGDEDASDWSRDFASRSTEVGGEEGQDLLFESSKQDVTPGDTSKILQLFEYDAGTSELVRLTKGENGYNEDGNGAEEGVRPSWFGPSAAQLGGGTDFKSAADRLNMSANGQTVAFETGGRLSPRATSAETRSPSRQHCFSVYEFHTDGRLDQGTVHLISDGLDTQIYKGLTCGAEFQAISPSGADIMFETDDPLLPTDSDGVGRDIYDARIGGGFPVVEAAPPASCGAPCEGIFNVAPTLLSPASAGDTGETPIVGPTPTNSKRQAERLVSKKKRYGKRPKGTRKRKSRQSRKVSIRATKGRQ